MGSLRVVFPLTWFDHDVIIEAVETCGSANKRTNYQEEGSRTHLRVDPSSNPHEEQYRESPRETVTHELPRSTHHFSALILVLLVFGQDRAPSGFRRFEFKVEIDTSTA
jgi:hypothetical protein